MKLICLTRLLLVVFAVAFQSSAQQSDSDRNTFEDTKAKAEKGDADAQFSVGYFYYIGQGVGKDAVEAVKWYRKAAEQSNAMAQFNLGVCYAIGEGVAKDEVEAVKWWRKAAEQHYANAQHNLGVCYRDGQGVVKDEVEAVKWFRKAAEQNLAGGQYNLGACYTEGIGVAKDYVEALKWYRKSADQNHPEAQSELGVCYAEGRGVAKNEVEAMNWHRKAVEGGATRGLNGLAWIQAVSQNPAIRDGSNAVVLAEKAVGATDRKVPAYLDTLAAAYAEAGQFEKAVSTQREAIALLKTEFEKENDYRTRLKLYEARRPYRAKD